MLLQALCVGCAQAAQQLWARVGAGAGLPAHLAALRAYLLLGRGDLFQAFLAQARAPIYSNPNPIPPSSDERHTHPAGLLLPAASHTGTPCAPEHSLVCGLARKEVRRVGAATAAAHAERFLQRVRGRSHHRNAPHACDGGRRRAARRARCWRCRRGRARPVRTRPPRCRRPPPPATPPPTRSSPTCGCALQRMARRPPRCGRRPREQPHVPACVARRARHSAAACTARACSQAVEQRLVGLERQARPASERRAAARLPCPAA